ncbi:MAG: ribosome-binding factor A [Thermaurantimonas sp.]
MKANRIARIESFLQEEFGNLFQRIGKSHFPGVLVSVTAVKISPDLSVARVYLSVFPFAKSSEVKEFIDTNYLAIKNESSKMLGKHLRIMPELNFVIDDAFEREEEIKRLLKEGGDNPIK